MPNSGMGKGMPLPRRKARTWIHIRAARPTDSSKREEKLYEEPLRKAWLRAPQAEKADNTILQREVPNWRPWHGSQSHHELAGGWGVNSLGPCSPRFNTVLPPLSANASDALALKGSNTVLKLEQHEIVEQ